MLVFPSGGKSLLIYAGIWDEGVRGVGESFLQASITTASYKNTPIYEKEIKK
jgi:hypothetical protein